MSKVCKNCGVKHSNSAVRCAMCHTAFNDTHIYARRRRLIILAVCVAILTASWIAYTVYSRTPQAAVRNIMNAYKKADVETLVSYYPDFYLKSDKLDNERILLDAQVSVNIMSQQLYTYYLEKPATPSDRICEELIDKLEYYGGENFERDKLGEIKMIWVNYRIDVYYFWPKKSTRFIVFEYDGRWCWWPENFNR